MLTHFLPVSFQAKLYSICCVLHLLIFTSSKSSLWGTFLTSSMNFVFSYETYSSVIFSIWMQLEMVAKHFPLMYLCHWCALLRHLLMLNNLFLRDTRLSSPNVVNYLFDIPLLCCVTTFSKTHFKRIGETHLLVSLTCIIIMNFSVFHAESIFLNTK